MFQEETFVGQLDVDRTKRLSLPSSELDASAELKNIALVSHPDSRVDSLIVKADKV
jgi:hypothetical protein